MKKIDRGKDNFIRILFLKSCTFAVFEFKWNIKKQPKINIPYD
jgi:hypothetical protein